MRIFFLLLCAHALTDFQLQNGAMWQNKQRQGCQLWYYWLTAHALICGGGVYVVTQSLFLGVCETIAHWVIDFWKCESRIGTHSDQLLHFLFRIVYAIYAMGV